MVVSRALFSSPTSVPENHKTYSTTHTTRNRIQTIERGCRQIFNLPGRDTAKNITILSSVLVPVTIQSNGIAATASVFLGGIIIEIRRLNRKVIVHGTIVGTDTPQRQKWHIGSEDRKVTKIYRCWFHAWVIAIVESWILYLKHNTNNKRTTISWWWLVVPVFKMTIKTFLITYTSNEFTVHVFR